MRTFFLLLIRFDWSIIQPLSGDTKGQISRSRTLFSQINTNGVWRMERMQLSGWKGKVCNAGSYTFKMLSISLYWTVKRKQVIWTWLIIFENTPNSNGVTNSVLKIQFRSSFTVNPQKISFFQMPKCSVVAYKDNRWKQKNKTTFYIMKHRFVPYRRNTFVFLSSR